MPTHEPRKLRLILLTSAFVILLMATTSPPALASSPPSWGQPQAISPELPSSWFPDIEADHTGTVHLVWAANLAPGNGNLTHAETGVVMVSQLGDGGWSPPGDVQVMDAGIASRPMVTGDGNYVYMIFRTGSLGTVGLYATRAPVTANLANAHSWSTPVLLASAAYYAQLLALPNHELLAVYNQEVSLTPDVIASYLPPLYQRNLAYVDPRTTSEQRPALFARRSTDGGLTWSVPVRVADGIKRIGRVSLVGSSDGKLVVAAWDEGYDNTTGQGSPDSVGTAVSTDGGQTWHDQHSLSSPTGPIEESTVAIGHDGALLVYRSTLSTDLFYRTSQDNGHTWSNEQKVPDAAARPYLGTHNFDKLDLAVDGDGRALLTYVGSDPEAPNGLSVMVATFSGGWTAPVVVASPHGYPEYPRLAVALGNQLHLVYYVRDNEFDVGHYTLWDVAGKSNARALTPIQPAPFPASTPKASAPVATPATQQVVPAPVVPAGMDRTDLRPPVSVLSSPMAFASLSTIALLLAIFVCAGGLRLLIRLRD